MTTTKQELIEFLKILDELEERQLYHKFDTIFPETGPYRRELYPKHINFLNSTKDHYECIFMAGNRTGKTLTAAYLVAMAAEGKYTKWYTGKKWHRGVNILCAGISSTTTRDVIQRELAGPVGAWGTGLISNDAITKGKLFPKANTAKALDMMIVPHSSGDVSTIYFTSYEQSEERLKGMKFDLIWLDEECPLDFYAEAVIRTMTTKGRIITTFTPDNGLTDTVLTFLKDGQIVEGSHKSRYLTHVDWDDVPHLDEETKLRMWEALPPHLRQAKKSGIPAVGSGAIYPISEQDIKIEPFDIPEYWPKAFGLDVGWHDLAVVWMAWDRENDITYIYDIQKVHKISPKEHAQQIKQKGAWIPGVCDPSAGQLARNERGTYLELYTREGLNIQYADNSVESGIMDVYSAFQNGKLKVFSNLQAWLNEFRLYRRDSHGRVLRDQDDHLMDATRYCYRTGQYVARCFHELVDEAETSNHYSTRNKYTGY